MDYMLAGLASVAAAFFINPIDVIKTRVQLQGELSARGTYAEPYKGLYGALKAIVKNDGWLGLQKGLVPNLYYQFLINAVGIGWYSTAKNKGWSLDENGKVLFSAGLFYGATGGIMGGIVSSPFYLIKTQLQSQAAKAIAVGHQHHHTSMSKALLEIFAKNGVMGLFQGVEANIPRTALGSGFQLGTFGKVKDLLRDNNLVVHPILNSFIAGLTAGSVMTVAMNPPDVVATRLYNQELDEHGKGVFYRGFADCWVKILKTEGLYGLYKGFWSHYLRMAPSSTLVLLFFDELCVLRDKIEASLKDS